MYTGRSTSYLNAQRTTADIIRAVCYAVLRWQRRPRAVSSGPHGPRLDHASLGPPLYARGAPLLDGRPPKGSTCYAKGLAKHYCKISHAY